MPGDDSKEEIKAASTDEPSVPRDDKDNNKKRQNNNKNKRKWNKKGKIGKNHTWREGGQGDADGDAGEKGSSGNKGRPLEKVHPGSYADPNMRELFQITLPPHLLPPAPEMNPTDRNAADAEEGEKDAEKSRNFSKKKVAFLLAYIGAGYAGFQTNEGQRTLQAEFELALLKAELISPLNMGYFHKYSWSTSGRTDKGVHACAQVCSAKIQVRPDQTLDDVREVINQHLPEDFRVLDVVRATKSFCAKTGRSRVRYQYMIPSFCFFEREELRALMAEIAPLETAGSRDKGVPLSPVEVGHIQDRIKNYRVKPEQLASLQQSLEKYVGTHSFHNFTKGLNSKDASATRYIVSFQVEKPMIFKDGIEWVPTQVIGQSFLLHQIRKMISLGLDSVRMNMPDLVTSALKKESRIRTNIAPAQGLFLEMSFYDGYNQKMQYLPDVDELEWDSEGTPGNDRWKQFRNEVIMDYIVTEEDNEGNFIQYLYNHEFYFDHTENYELPVKKSGE